MNAVHRVTCKDCGEEFAFGDNLRLRRRAQGLSTDERCAACRQKAGRESVAVGLRYFVLPGLHLTGAASGSALGHLDHPKRLHKSFSPDRDPRAVLQEGCGLEPADAQLVFDTAKDKRVLVIIAPTGLGKSTLLPYSLVNPPEALEGRRDQFTRYGQVVVSQPRRVAAEGISRHVALAHSGADDAIGPAHDTGYAIGGDHQFSEDNLVVQMTDGVLLNQIAAGRLGTASVVIIDEAHERNPSIDLILGLLRREMVLYPHLRVMIVSATIDAEQFVGFFGEEAAMIDWSDRTKDVTYEKRFPDQPVGDVASNRLLERSEIDNVIELTILRAEEAARMVLEVGPNNELYGDVLVFAPTKALVESVVATLRDQLQRAGIPYPVLPLYRELDEDETERAKALDPSPKVIVATTIAETSITFPNLRHVVDNGLVLFPRWDPKTGENSYGTEYHSLAGCRQRWGRVGRTASGIAWCTYQEDELKGLCEYTPPALLTSDLTPPLLRLVSDGLDLKGLGQLQDFFLASVEEDDRAYLENAFRLTSERALAEGLMTNDGDLTDLGRQTVASEGNRERAQLLPLADRHGCIIEAATFLAARDVGWIRTGGFRKFERPLEAYQADTRVTVEQRRSMLLRPDADQLDSILALLAAWERLTRVERDHVVALCLLDKTWFEKVLDRRADLLAGAAVRTKAVRAVDPGLGARLRTVLAVAWPHRVWKKSATQANPKACRYEQGDKSAQVGKKADGRPECLLALMLRDQGNSPQKAIKEYLALPEQAPLSADQLLCASPTGNGQSEVEVLLGRFRSPLGTNVEVVGASGGAANANVACEVTNQPWKPIARWGDQAAVRDSVQQARRAAQVADPEYVSSTGSTPSITLDDDLVEEYAWSNEAVDEGESASGGEAQQAIAPPGSRDKIESDSAASAEPRVLITAQIAPGFAPKVGDLATVTGYDNGVPVVAPMPKTPSEQLIDKGIKAGDELEVTVAERSINGGWVRVNLDSCQEISLHLDATQLNFEDVPAATKIAKETKLKLRVSAVFAESPYVVLTRLPYLEEAYNLACPKSAKQYEAQLVERLERRAVVSFSVPDRVEPLLATVADDEGLGVLARNDKREVFSITVRRRAVSERVTEVPELVRDALKAAGIEVGPGEPSELSAADPLRFETLVEVHSAANLLDPAIASELSAAVEVLYRRSNCPLATVIETVANAGAPDADAPARRRRADAETGTVRAIYEGKNRLGPGLWVGLGTSSARGFLRATELPDSKQLNTFRVDEKVRVQRAETVNGAGSPSVLLLAYRGSVDPATPPKKGERFDDAKLIKKKEGRALLQFAGARFVGLVAETDFDRVSRANPKKRAFGVQVLRNMQGNSFWVNLLDADAGG